MASSRRIVLLLLLFCAVYAEKTCEEQLQELIANERREDTETHECRACKRISIAPSNCPKMGYDCSNLMLPLTSYVLFPDECNCAQLRCADANAILAVKGNLVGKVRCKGLKWNTPDGVAASAACARKCGLGVCKELPKSAFEGQDIIGPLDIRPPDNEHPCAWATCAIGAIAAIEVGVPDVVFKGTSNFACTGAPSWRYTGPGAERRNLQVVACVIKDCNSLPGGFTNEVCTNGKYMCYAATMEEGDGDDWKKMTCPEPHALRRTDNNEEIAPTCKIGTWTVNGGLIESSTEVMCITCPTPNRNPNDQEKPVIAANNKAVTCDNGKLTIEFESGGVQQVEVTSLTCTNSFEWTATGGDFTPFASLEEVVNNGISWKVRCITEPPKPCAELPFEANAGCGTKFECYTAKMVDDGGDGSKKMICSENDKALRASDDATEIAPTCMNGLWSAPGRTIDSGTKVMCIACIKPITDPADADHPPTIEPNNKFVTCDNGGQLTVEYESSGNNQQTQVTSLTCSAKFDWTSTGGDFKPYLSLEDAVSNGVTWKARCILAAPKPCKPLPTTDKAPECAQGKLFPFVKYECNEASFKKDSQNPEFHTIMACGANMDVSRLRYANDPDTLISPECINGQWNDNGKDIPETTEVTCVSCRPLSQVETDDVVWAYDDGKLPKTITCPSKTMYIDLRKDQQSVQKIVSTPITCNVNTWLWETATVLTPYSSIPDMFKQKVEWAVRCLNPGEDK